MKSRDVNASGNGGRDPDREIYEALEPVIRGLGMALIELSVFRGKGRGAGNVQVRLVVLGSARNGSSTGIDDCSRVHRAVMPRLELAFPEKDIYLEVSSPGIDRLIKDADEFVHYIGREIKCYRSDISDWSKGVLFAVEADRIILSGEEVDLSLPFEKITKARLSGLPPPGRGG